MTQTYTPARRERYRQLLLQGVSPTALVMATPSQQIEDARMHRWICKLLDFWRKEETRFPEFPGLTRSVLRSERAIQSAMTRAGVAVGDHLEARADPQWSMTVSPEETYRV